MEMIHKCLVFFADKKSLIKPPQFLIFFCHCRALILVLYSCPFNMYMLSVDHVLYTVNLHWLNLFRQTSFFVAFILGVRWFFFDVVALVPFRNVILQLLNRDTVKAIKNRTINISYVDVVVVMVRKHSGKYYYC